MINKNESMLVQLNVKDFQQLIREAVQEEMTKITEVIKLNPQSSERDSKELLTRDETSNLLKVSYTTLFNWNREETLKAKKIGRKVFYLRSDVMDKLNSVA